MAEGSGMESKKERLKEAESLLMEAQMVLHWCDQRFITWTGNQAELLRERILSHLKIEETTTHSSASDKKIKQDPAKTLSFIIDEAVADLQAFLQESELPPEEQVGIGDVIANLYDYNQAYKIQTYNQKLEG